MQTNLEKDKTARLSVESHYRLKLMSLNTGKSVRELINHAVEQLVEQNPASVQPHLPSKG